MEHLQKVFPRLRENKLYVKFEKCEFNVMEVNFLGKDHSKRLEDG